jgi:hypothetical protein
MSSGCIPEKTEDVAHIHAMIIRKPATCTNYRLLEAKRSPHGVLESHFCLRN